MMVKTAKNINSNVWLNTPYRKAVKKSRVGKHPSVKVSKLFCRRSRQGVDWLKNIVRSKILM
jgi:hypothetical protein